MEADPNALTKYKDSVVSKRFHGAVSVLLRFHKRVQMSEGLAVSQSEQLAFDTYATAVRFAREVLDAPDFWSDNWIMGPPQVLPDVLHAFVGALLVDSKHNKTIMDGFFNSFIKPYFVDIPLDE
jgi:endoribonuclease Dicer